MILPGYKTILFSLATITLGVLQGLGYTNVIAQNPGVAVTASGIITLLLRLITSTVPAINVAMTPKAALQTPTTQVVTAAAKAIAANP